MSETVKACYDNSTQTWEVDTAILKAVKNDIQSIVECAKDGDKIHFVSTKDIRPLRTIVIDKDIFIGSSSNKQETARNRPSDLTPNVRLLCPNSGELIIAK